LFDPKAREDVQGQVQEINAAARVLGRQIHVLNVSTDGDIERPSAILL
jgi:hypothetical protein